MHARIGWLMRAWRSSLGMTLSDVSDKMRALGYPVASDSLLSDRERRGVRDGQFIDAYELALGLPAGQLRCPIDLVSQMFDWSPPDPQPTLRDEVTQADFDGAYELISGQEPSGSDWYRFARMLSGTVVRTSKGDVDRVQMVVPSRVVAPLAARLIGELVRSVGFAYMTRSAATTILHDGVHRSLVEKVVRDMVLDEGAQSVLINALGAVADRPTTSLIAWAAETLNHPTPWAVVGASYALGSMRTAAAVTPEDWQVVAPQFVKAWSAAAAAGDQTRTATLNELLRNLPSEVRNVVETELGLVREQASKAAPNPWDGPINEHPHYPLCARIGEALGDKVLGYQGEYPILARLIFELVYELRSPRRSAAQHYLMCSPFIDSLEVELLNLVEYGDDDATRSGALKGLHFVQAGRVTAPVQEWFDRTQPWTNPSALVTAGNAGITLPDEMMNLVVDDSEQSLRVVEALGMTRHPSLTTLSTEATRPSAVRAVAGWWVEHGGRVAV